MYELLRARFLGLKGGRSLTMIGKEIGVSGETLSIFQCDTRKLRMTTIDRIEAWCEQQEFLRRERGEE